jgi:hypothetical protein
LDFRELAFVFGALAACSSLRGSSVLYDSGAPGYGDAFVSDPQFPVQYGSDFTFGGPASLTGLTWFGAYKPPGSSVTIIGPDNFEVRIFGTTAGTPNVAPLFDFTGLLVTKIDTGGSLSFPGEELYHYGVSVPSTILGPGTYFLSIINNTVAGDELWLWAWSNQSFQAGNALYSRTADGGTWVGPFTTQVSFQLRGDTATPEPATFVLSAIGLGAFVGGHLRILRPSRAARPSGRTTLHG